MFIHRSNRAEHLVGILAELVATPLGDWTAPETIVVQGRGMERWLAMRLAESHGICARTTFPFPRTFIDEAITAVLGEPPEPSVYSMETLRWAVAAVLPQMLNRPRFAPLHHYVDGGPPRRLLQLADRIATCFDRYIVYRPAMLLGWERGGPTLDEDTGTAWQVELWRALVERYGADHLASRALALQRHLQQHRTEGTAALGLPPRVCLFGVGSLPPLYVDILETLGRRIEMHLLMLSPSPEWYADARSSVLDDPVHPLVGSLGRMSRDFLNLLADRLDDVTAGDHFVAPDTTSLLGALQNDLLELRSPDGSEERTDDGSIAVHACHGPLREVEVLHDQLLGCFDADKTLTPNDVCVLTPDIETYAPYIHAVFGSDSRLPHRVSDRPLRVAGVVVDGFFRLLDVVQGRARASELLDLLNLDAIRERFGIAQEDLTTLRGWLQETNIRWGIDAEHRARDGQPATDANTWRLGLDRLLLGYAMDDRTPFEGVLPLAHIEGSEAVLAGTFVEFVETVFAVRRELNQPRPVAEWPPVLSHALEGLFASASRQGQHQHLRNAFADIAAGAARAGFDEPLPLPAIQDRLDAALSQERSTAPFLTGGITFCQLVPMRSIPFRVIALLGMNDEAFPREDRPASFDLVAGSPRAGDRTIRDEDRAVFLEVVLSARDRLLITYVGQGLKDNVPIPPSVVVSELLDAVSPTLVCHHPLQAFSPRYFAAGEDPRLFSYNTGAEQGARRLLDDASSLKPFVDAVVETPTVTEGTFDVGLDDLEIFFRNPSRAYARRLGIFLGDDDPSLDDRQPLTLDHLDRWKLGTELLELQLGKETWDTDVYERERLAGRLPPGTLGRYAFRQVEPIVQALVKQAAPLLEEEPHPSIPIELTLGPFRLTGILHGVRPGGLAYAQYSRSGDTRDVRYWIRHLVWNRIAQGSMTRQSALVARSLKGVGTLRFGPVENAESILLELLTLYRAGLSLPLPFFRYASRAYVDTFASSHNETKAMRSARTKFGTLFEPVSTGLPVSIDAADPYVRRVFRYSEPLGSTLPDAAPEGWRPFSDVAHAVYGPLLRHLRREGP